MGKYQKLHIALYVEKMSKNDTILHIWFLKLLMKENIDVFRRIQHPCHAPIIWRNYMLNDSRFKNIIQQVANSIASVLNVEIMIMDNKFNIVGGTAQRKGQYNVSNVYRYLMESQKPIIIEEPGFHELCEGCLLYKNCPEIVEIDSPIILNEKSIGVISLVGYTIEHKEIMLSRKEDYLVFLTRMSEMISSKVSEVVCANLIIGQLAHRKVGQYQYN